MGLQFRLHSIHQSIRNHTKKKLEVTRRIPTNKQAKKSVRPITRLFTKPSLKPRRSRNVRMFLNKFAITSRKRFAIKNLNIKQDMDKEPMDTIPIITISQRFVTMKTNKNVWRNTKMFVTMKLNKFPTKNPNRFLKQFVLTKNIILMENDSNQNI